MISVKYRYSAIASDGSKSTGMVEAGSEQEAYRKVSAFGITPVKLSQVRDMTPTVRRGRISSEDIAAFTRELSVLVEAKIPLARGLLSIAEHEDKMALKMMIRDIASSIEAGLPITDALAKYRDHFSSLYIETVRAAEKSGNLVAVMAHLAELLEKQTESRQQLRRALTYPSIVLFTVFLAVTVIVGFVVPKFAATFRAQKIQLPMITRVIQAIGFSVRDYWYIYLAVFLAAIFGLIAAWRSPSGRVVLEKLMVKIPYIGRIIVSVTAARFARVFSIGLTSGLNLIESLENGGRATGRPVFAQECDQMADRLRRGEQLQQVLRETSYLPSFARRMMSAGKDSAELARACDVVARHFDREASHLTRNINTFIEPVLTIALAGVVLLVAMSVFMPMWEMVGVRK